ncbi:MAG: LamG-like jellyroll fold domain-containing protein, partial [Opitutales bacterium]
MASNNKALLSASGESYDWIEIHNPGANPVDLGDWYLTDDPTNPTMWRFPAGTIIDPDERLVVFASGLGSAGSAGELHTTFKLDASGGYLALLKGDGTIGKVFSNYPKQEEDYAYGTPERTTGLIARWKFDESSGTVARDSVPPPPGLVAGGLAGSFNLTDPNPGNLNENGTGATNGVDPLGPTLGNLNSKPPWQDNFTVVYSGQIYDADGKMSFIENIDDAAWLKVKEQVLLNNQGWNTTTTQAVDFGSGGWYDFELRMGNGGGGAGFVTAPGFGFDPAGGSNFQFPQNSSAGLGDLFRTRSPLDASISGESSPTWEPGKFGNALRFDGVDDVATHVLPSSVTLAAYTLSLWVNPDGANQANNVSFFNSGSTGKDFQIGFDGSGQYKLAGDSGSGIFGPAVENWTHLAVVSDGTTRRLYLNGSFAASVANADNVFQHYRFGVNRGGSLFFKGLLDEVRLFDVALSDAQILALLGNGTAPAATYLNSPTPGKENDTGFPGFVADTKFSVDRGFYETSFTLAITTATPGATIRYTTDGSTPSAIHGNIYASPLTIASTTIVRAIATKPDYLPTGVDTQSYFFSEDVIRQSANGSTPSSWPNNGAVNSQKMVYGMDPDIVEGFNTPEEVKEALLAIPILSIATELDNLFGKSNGIYVNARKDGRTWERPMSLELIHPDGSEGFQVDAGLRIRGGYSRSANNPKHSFRVFFRSEYGQGNLHYPMFEDEGVEEFDKFDLRTSQNYSWAFGGPANNTMVREVWSRDTQGAMGRPYTRSRYYHLYLNGIYWGIYMTQERVSGTLGESYLGGDKDDYDTVHQDSSRQVNATGGNLEAYDRLWQRTIDGWTNNDVYFQAQGLEPDGKTINPAYERLLDVDNLADYMLIVYYNGDRDGPASRYTTPRVNNYYALYNRVNPDGWKFPAHDMEHSLGRGENNMVTPLASAHRDRDEKKYFTAHFLHEQLTSNQEYVIHFADRFYLRHYNDGILTEESAKARIAFRAAQIDKAIIAESARWGDTKSGVPKNRTDWVNNVNMVTNWMTGRNAVVLNQLRTTRINASSPYWYPSIDPPGFSQHGGQVGSSFRLSMIDPNGTAVTIHYTLDGSDPRLIGGAVSSAAQVVQPSGMQNTILLDAGAPAKAFVPTDGSQGTAWTLPGFDDSTWQSGSSGIGYDTATTYRSLFGVDVIAMRNKNASVYCRLPFTTTDITEFTNLTLRMKYDDGFVAYLNGEKVASAAASANPAWNATATSSHRDSAAQQYVSFDLTPHIAHLREGANVLAIHGLNVSTSSSDMLIVPRLEASKIVGGTEIALPHYLTTVKARARSASGEWSALHGAIFQVDVVPASIDNLILSEIMYNPAGTEGSEYVEIRNLGPFRIDLTGVTLGDAFDDFTFGPLTLASGESAVV